MEHNELKSQTGLSIKTLTLIAQKFGLSGIDEIDEVQIARIKKIKEIHNELTSQGMNRDDAVIPAIETFLKEEQSGEIVIRNSSAVSEFKDVEEQVPPNILEDIHGLTTELAEEKADGGTKDFIEGAVAGAFEASDKMESLSLEYGKRYAEGLMLQKRIAALHNPEKAGVYHDFFLQAVNQQREARKKP